MYIIPEPQKIVEKQGNFIFRYDHKILLKDSCGREQFYHAGILKREIEESAGVSLQITRGESKRAAITLELCQEKNIKEEGYLLQITANGVFVQAKDTRGLLYGIQTLRQIIRQEGGQLSCLEIEDYPQLQHRGFYHDATRGRVPTLEWLKSLADTLSFYKINQMQLYIEHTYLFEGLSEVWRDDTPLTSEEILELDAYCTKLGVELVPSLSCFGHLYKLLSTKQYRHLSEIEDAGMEPFRMYDRMAHHTIHVLEEESYALIKSLILEYMSLFTSSHFNICADETFDLGKGKTKEKADEIGVNRLYIDFVKKLCDIVVSKGKTPMFWGDVICGFPEFIHELPKETICLNWGYAWNQSEYNTEAMAKAGATQYVCPGTGSWNQFIPLLKNSYLNITRMCEFGKRHQAIGVLNTDWGDFGHINHPSFSIPGMIYGAEFSWNEKMIEFEELNRRISKIEYRDASENFLSIVEEISTKFVYGWWSAVMYQEAIATKGEDGKQYVLKEEEISQVEEKNTALLELEGKLAQCLQYLDTSKRADASDYMIAAEGMRVLNEVGLAVSGCITDSKQLLELAEKLENWFYYYKQLWRTKSKESELYQLTHIICWYADHIRELAGR